MSFVGNSRRPGVGVIAGLAALVLLLAACGSNSGQQAAPGKATDTVSWAEAPTSTPDWIWPFYTSGNNSVTNIDFISMLFRPLYTFGDQGQADVSVPLSLAQLPSWSNGGKTATITMKANYKFSNGEPITAQDVLFNLNMYAAEKANEANYVPGGIPDNIVSASAPNSSTLVITTDRAYSQHWFLYNELSQLTPWPTAWDVTAGGSPSNCAGSVSDCAAVYTYLDAQSKSLSTYATNPLWQIVDGPWKLKSFSTSGSASLVPNPAYGGPTKAAVKQFNLLPFTTDSAEFNVLRSGKTLDVGYIPTQDISSPHPAGASPLTPGPNPLSSQYTMAPWFLYSFNYFPLNFNGPQAAILKQLYFRQALQSVVDQNGILSAVAKGYGAPTLGPVPTVPPSSLDTSNEKTNLYPFSIAKATTYLRDNGWSVKPNGTDTCSKPGTGSGECGPGIAAGTPLAFTLPYATGIAEVTTSMGSLKSNAAQAGIQLTLRGETFNNVIENYSTACAAGTAACDWTMANWGGGWAYGPDYFPTGDTLFATGAIANSGSYSDPTSDHDISTSLLASGGQDAFNSYEQYLAKEVPVLWQPNFTYQLTEYGRGLHGVAPNSPLGFIFPEEWHY